nr:uncharacterized protein LOC117278301 [Nicotiana tomentosiformis]
MRSAVQLLTRLVATQAQRQNTGVADRLSLRSSATPVASSPPQFQRPWYDQSIYSAPGQSSRASGSQYHEDTSQTRPLAPHCDQCGKAHFGLCCRGSDACYAYRQCGHMMRYCPNRGGGGMGKPIGYPPTQGFQQSKGRGKSRGVVPSSSDTQN